MPASRQSGLAPLNTSIRLFRKNAALNTSRKILQKSVNRSIISAASLKSNNASLAKRLGELQIELQSQRTAAYNANIEANKLRLQLAQVHMCMESRNRLKECLVLLREQVTSMFEAGVNVTRCVDEVSRMLDCPNIGDPSIMLSESASKLINSDHLKERSHLVAPNLNATASPDLSSLEARLRNVITKRPRVPDVSTDQASVLAPKLTPNPVPKSGGAIPGCSIFNPESPVPSVQTTPVMVHLESPLSLKPKDSDSLVTLDLKQSPSHVPAYRSPPSMPPPTAPSPLSPSLSFQPTPSSTEVPLPSDLPSPIVRLENHIPTAQLPSPIAPRAHLMREARCKAVPIVDASPTLLESPYSKPARSKRRRVVREQDSGDDENTGGRKSKKSLTRKSLGPHANPPGPRVVEVHMNRPGQVAFRADLKHSTERVEASGSRSKKSANTVTITKGYSKDTGAPNAAKSVFDLSANQTANISILPPTLDELRQKELAKKQQPLQESSRNQPVPTSFPQPKPPLLTNGPNSRYPSAVGVENVDPTRISTVLTSSIGAHEKGDIVPTGPKFGRKTPARSPLQSAQKPTPRFRRLYLRDDDEIETEPMRKRRSSTRVRSSPDASSRQTRSKLSRRN
ncbi:unnamed protein product [Dicrocoelium dendriticum]|nr:unnamed protein product [Dicrocoelium dendriticum]